MLDLFRSRVGIFSTIVQTMTVVERRGTPNGNSQADEGKGGKNGGELHCAG